MLLLRFWAASCGLSSADESLLPSLVVEEEVLGRFLDGPSSRLSRSETDLVLSFSSAAVAVAAAAAAAAFVFFTLALMFWNQT